MANENRLIAALNAERPACPESQYDIGYNNGLTTAIAIAMKMDPTDVVRCKDCKHYHKETAYCDLHSYFVDSDMLCCSPAESPNWTMFDEMDYCSRGERRTDDDE